MNSSFFLVSPSYTALPAPYKRGDLCLAEDVLRLTAAKEDEEHKLDGKDKTNKELSLIDVGNCLNIKYLINPIWYETRLLKTIIRRKHRG